MLLFVYGTLLRGEANAHHLQHATFVDVDQTPPAFALVNLGDYPGLLANGETSVSGEVYEIQAEHLPALDAFEEHPDLYLRTTITLASGRTALAYLLRPQHALGAPVLPGGDWRLRPA